MTMSSVGAPDLRKGGAASAGAEDPQGTGQRRNGHRGRLQPRLAAQPRSPNPQPFPSAGVGFGFTTSPLLGSPQFWPHSPTPLRFGCLS